MPLTCQVPNCTAPRLLLGLLLLSGIALLTVTFDANQIEQLLLWVQQNKAQGSALFILLYTLGVILMLPEMVMAMASGAVFGVSVGTLLAWVGSTIGQMLAFAIGRYLLREMVLSYLGRHFPKWPAIDRALSMDAWKLVTLLRLSPIAPWNVLNYALSVTSVPVVPYALASSLAILPYLILFVYFGSLARNLADIFTGAAAPLDPITSLIMGIVSTVALVAVVWYTTHISRQAVSRALHAEDLPPELTGDEDVITLLAMGNVPPQISSIGPERHGPETGGALELTTSRATHVNAALSPRANIRSATASPRNQSPRRQQRTTAFT